MKRIALINRQGQDTDAMRAITLLRTPKTTSQFIDCGGTHAWIGALQDIGLAHTVDFLGERRHRLTCFGMAMAKQAFATREKVIDFLRSDYYSIAWNYEPEKERLQDMAVLSVWDGDAHIVMAAKIESYMRKQKRLNEEKGE